jgi:acyl-homoserine-lactone acylase
MRRSLLAVILLCGCGQPKGPDKTEILWDTWGVPHIFAKDEAGLFKAFGAAQARSHGNLILKLYGEARGRAAEYWGEQGLDNDHYVRMMGIPARAQVWYAAQDSGFRRALDAFAEGVNEYAKEHPSEIADSVKPVLPISGIDLLAHTQRVINFTFVYGQERALAAFRRPAGARAGSNTWAIGPKRSASGKAMLLANPHLGWADLFLFYESQFVAPGLDAYGATLVGIPAPAIAFNDELGWSHTVNTIDAADEYRLIKAPGGYRYGGKVEPFTERTELIQVKLAGGGTRIDTFVVRSSVHGPVIADSSSVAIAVKVAGLDRPGALKEWWDMARAKSLAEFESAVKRLEIPMFNVMYADRAGHIYYLFGGDVPVRSKGDVAFWADRVSGDSPETLWDHYLSYEQLPRLVDPATGWLQNANDPPWTSTVPVALRPESFPPYLAPSNMAFRPQRSAHMLAADSSITFDELVAYKHSTRMELADRLVDELVGLGQKGSPAAARGAAVLAKWDRQANADSRGAVLFETWVQTWYGMARPKLFAKEWNIDDPIRTPAGIADPAKAVKALEAAVNQVEKVHGAADVPWGDVNRLRYGGKDLPGNGAPGDPYGVFRTAYYVPGDDGKASIAGGDTYYAAIEFGTPVRAKVLLAYGNSTQPGSKHLGDQLELFAKQEMRDVWRDRKTIEAHLESREEIR